MLLRRDKAGLRVRLPRGYHVGARVFNSVRSNLPGTIVNITDTHIHVLWDRYAYGAVCAYYIDDVFPDAPCYLALYRQQLSDEEQLTHSHANVRRRIIAILAKRKKRDQQYGEKEK